MGFYLDMIQRSEYDTDTSQMTERDRLVHEATMRIDAEQTEKERKAKVRRLYDAASDTHDEDNCEDHPCKDCVEEIDFQNSPARREQDASEWFHSGQPMGDWDH